MQQCGKNVDSTSVLRSWKKITEKGKARRENRRQEGDSDRRFEAFPAPCRGAAYRDVNITANGNRLGVLGDIVPLTNKERGEEIIGRMQGIVLEITNHRLRLYPEVYSSSGLKLVCWENRFRSLSLEVERGLRLGLSSG